MSSKWVTDLWTDDGGSVLHGFVSFLGGEGFFGFSFCCYCTSKPYGACAGFFVPCELLAYAAWAIGDFSSSVVAWPRWVVLWDFRVLNQLIIVYRFIFIIYVTLDFASAFITYRSKGNQTFRQCEPAIPCIKIQAIRYINILFYEIESAADENFQVKYIISSAMPILSFISHWLASPVLQGLSRLFKM